MKAIVKTRKAAGAELIEMDVPQPTPQCVASGQHPSGGGCPNTTPHHAARPGRRWVLHLIRLG